jgi:hypothetical protein
VTATGDNTLVAYHSQDVDLVGHQTMKARRTAVANTQARLINASWMSLGVRSGYAGLLKACSQAKVRSTTAVASWAVVASEFEIRKGRPLRGHTIELTKSDGKRITLPVWSRTTRPNPTMEKLVSLLRESLKDHPSDTSLLD